MTVIINKFVIHQLIKEKQEPALPLDLKDDLLPTDNITVINLMNGILNAYGRKNSSAQYGVFETKDYKGQFPKEFKDYFSIEEQKDSDFLKITFESMKQLHEKASAQPLATGGYIVFSDYTVDSVRFFLIAMIKQKDGYRIVNNKNTLNVEDLVYLDLSRLHQAAKINFNKFDSYQLADEDEKNDITYLSFVSPLTQKDTAGYFINALGCKPGTPSQKLTMKVVSESVNFFKSKPILSSYSDELRSQILSYLTDKISSEPISTAKLSEIENIARRFFPADDHDLLEELSEEFITRLNSDEVGIPVEFNPNFNAIKKLTRIRYKDKNFVIDFDRNDLGTEQDDKLCYTNGKLIINQMPKDLIKQIEEQLGLINEDGSS